MKTAGLLVSGLLLVFSLIVPFPPAASSAAPPDPSEKTWAEPFSGMEFLWVEGGCYQMGCAGWAGGCDVKETPPHEVCVDGFWMGKYEVTQGQWMKVMESNPSSFSACGENCPVEKVSWKDVQGYIEKLSRQAELQVRLPTEAEWEFAARSGGKQERFAGFAQEKELFQYGNFCDTNCEKDWKIKNQDDGFKNTSPVGSFKPNGLGLHDMTGNVWEWCGDWFGEQYYAQSPRENPTGPPQGFYHPFRGGGWNSPPGNSRTVRRDRRTESNRRDNIGFRLVLPQAQP